VNAAAHPAGSAVISWAGPRRTTIADPGTILGGFGTPVVIDGAAAAYPSLSASSQGYGRCSGEVRFPGAAP
jgi:hypothetical protein